MQRFHIQGSQNLKYKSLLVGVIHERYVAFGGAERYLSALISALVKKGFRVCIFATQWTGKAPLAGVSIQRVPVVRFPRWVKALSFAFAARKNLLLHPCDVTLSLDRTLGQDVYRAAGGCHRGWLRARRRFSPLYRTLLTWLNPLHFVLLYIEKRIYDENCTRRVIALSDQGAREIETLYGFPRSKIDVVYLGVDLEYFRPALQRADVGTFDIAFVGTGWERKGLAFAIRAIQHLPANVRLNIYGKGKRRSFVRLARISGVGDRVFFHGVATDMAAVYQRNHLLLHPAIYEPFGNVCLEALASGLPVVVSRATGASEVVTPELNGAVIDDPSDAHGIAQAVQRFLVKTTWLKASRAARAAAETLPFSRNVEQTLRTLELASQAHFVATNDRV